MPSNLLPKPCPKCGKKYGTITFQTFSNNNILLCRIKHYNKEGYKKAMEKIKAGKVDLFTAISIRTTWQQEWCNFRTEHKFFEKEISWRSDSGIDKWKCRVCHIEEPYNDKTRYHYWQCREDIHKPEIIRQTGVKSKSYKITDEIINTIKKNGWKKKPSSSSGPSITRRSGYISLVPYAHRTKPEALDPPYRILRSITVLHYRDSVICGIYLSI